MHPYLPVLAFALFCTASTHDNPAQDPLPDPPRNAARKWDVEVTFTVHHACLAVDFVTSSH